MWQDLLIGKLHFDLTSTVFQATGIHHCSLYRISIPGLPLSHGFLVTVDHICRRHFLPRPTQMSHSAVVTSTVNLLQCSLSSIQELVSSSRTVVRRNSSLVPRPSPCTDKKIKRQKTRWGLGNEDSEIGEGKKQTFTRNQNSGSLA